MVAQTVEVKSQKNARLRPPRESSTSQLLKTSSLEEGALNTVQGHGGADTNGAIARALLWGLRTSGRSPARNETDFYLGQGMASSLAARPNSRPAMLAGGGALDLMGKAKLSVIRPF
jgi:hypothetical protein